MQQHLLSAALGAAALSLSACGTDADPDLKVSALLEVPGRAAADSGFYALPFPNDLRLDADGTVDLSQYPRPNALVEDYVEAIDEYQVGFSVSGANFARFDGAIDPASLPPTPSASTAPDASVYLVDIDPISPGFGERVPLRLRFEVEGGETINDNWLSALPFPGFVLREKTTYALVITDRVRSADGDAVAAAPTFELIAGDGELMDPLLQQAREVYAPLLSWLDAPGEDERTDVVTASIFTTQDTTSMLGELREAVWRDAAAALPREMLLVRLEDDHAWYDGIYDAPIAQAGEVPYRRISSGGAILVDEQGAPVLDHMESFRFSFSVPLGTPPAGGWPVVLYAHGTGGSYHTYHRNGSAASFAERGLAVLSIDQVMHGPRNPGGNPDIDYFNFQNPLAARDNTLQGAVDYFQLVRMVTDFDHTLSDGRRVIFDPDRIYYFGHSQGALSGVPFVARETLVSGTIISAGGGLLYLSLLNKSEPFDIPGLVSLILRDRPLDEFNPILALLQGYLDRADGASYGRLLVDERPADAVPLSIFQSLGLVDSFTPIPSIKALAVSIGLDLVEPVLEPVEGLELLGREPISAPVMGNRGSATVVLLEYEAAPGADGHFVLFETAAGRRQSVEFLATLAESGQATVVAP